MLRQVVPLAMALAGLAGAAHNPLLPRPLKIRYGQGWVRVSELSSRFTNPASEEDRFVQKYLAGRLPFSARGARALALNRTGNGAALPGLDETTGPDSREAYSMKISSDGAEVTANSSAGLFYAAQTILQLAEGPGASARLPEVEIEDYPALAYRGFMMDMSHGGLPTVEEVKRQIDFLTRWKANQYFFYSEASIELKGHPLLNPAARFTQDEVRRIVAYGRERHIDVVPCVELYGHLHDLFRLEKYAGLAPLRYGGEFDPRNPAALLMIGDWVRQLVNIFPSPFFHIGMDETYELERVASPATGGPDPGRLYIDHFKRVARIVEDCGKRPMLWADILAHYPEVIPELKGGAIAIPWVYGPETDYARHLAPFAAAQVPTFIATAVTNWEDLTPKFTRTFDNVDRFLSAGRKHGVLGMLHTGWTDDAQVLFRPALPAVAYGVIAPWQAAPIERGSFFSDYARLMYPDAAAAHVAAALEALRQADDLLFEGLGGRTRFQMWLDPLEPERMKFYAGRRGQLREARIHAEQAQEHLLEALARGADPATLDGLLLGARTLDYAGMKPLFALQIADYVERCRSARDEAAVRLFLRIETADKDHSLLADLADTAMELKEEFARNWLNEFTRYRLGAALGRWDMEYQYWRRLQMNLDLFSRSYKQGQEVPALEAFRPGNSGT
jgi:hexosaminidase